MKSSITGKKFHSVFKTAGFWGLVYTAIAFVLNSCVVYPAGQGEWVIAFALVQLLPLECFLHITGLAYILPHKLQSGLAEAVLASISDGFWLTLILLIVGSIRQFTRKNSHEPKN